MPRTDDERRKAAHDKAIPKIRALLSEHSNFPLADIPDLIRCIADPSRAAGSIARAIDSGTWYAPVRVWAASIVALDLPAPISERALPDELTAENEMLTVATSDVDDLVIAAHRSVLTTESPTIAGEVGLPMVHAAHIPAWDVPGTHLVTCDRIGELPGLLSAAGLIVDELPRLQRQTTWGFRWSRKRLSVQADAPVMTVNLALGLPPSRPADLDRFAHACPDTDLLRQVPIGITGGGALLWGNAAFEEEDEDVRIVYSTDTEQQAATLVWRFATRSYPTHHAPSGEPLYRLPDFHPDGTDLRGLAHVTHTLRCFDENDPEAWSSVRARALRRGLVAVE